MRSHGKLATWNGDRGFGYIEPSGGNEQIFVHLAAFPRDGVAPQTGEFVSFDADVRSDGSKQALRVNRPGARAKPHEAAASPGLSRPRRLFMVLGALAVMVIGVGIYLFR